MAILTHQSELLLVGKHPQNFMLTLFQPEGADYAHQITASTPGFENLTTSLPIVE